MTNIFGWGKPKSEVPKVMVESELVRPPKTKIVDGLEYQLIIMEDGSKRWARSDNEHKHYVGKIACPVCGEVYDYSILGERGHQELSYKTPFITDGGKGILQKTEGGFQCFMCRSVFKVKRIEKQ